MFHRRFILAATINVFQTAVLIYYIINHCDGLCAISNSYQGFKMSIQKQGGETRRVDVTKPIYRI